MVPLSDSKQDWDGMKAKTDCLTGKMMLVETSKVIVAHASGQSCDVVDVWYFHLEQVKLLALPPNLFVQRDLPLSPLFLWILQVQHRKRPFRRSYSLGALRITNSSIHHIVIADPTEIERTETHIINMLSPDLL